ncbi:androgen-dependent TFPI-regulating protein-like [Leptidea sinapis]|uniref:androgen-dependent TFPI-regulating protein-like n=1 Tax=Leptidea sinapis TaxID=189913 RepID=UPI00213C92A0|nr:androgen-dependent TFPI-regulating protein-like [Leptidea sinapis]
MALPILHLAAAVLFCYSIWYDQNYVKLVVVKNLDGYPCNNRVLFLTIWCLVIQTVYFIVACINDIFGTNERTPLKPPTIRKIKDALFSLAFPLAIYVTVAFWSIYLWDKELIFPEHVRKAFPVWLNHAMHTMVSVFMIVEMLTSYKTYPSRLLGYTLMSCVVLPYIALLFILYGQTGLWVYPVFAYMNWAGRIVFMGSSVCLAYGLYFASEKINNILHPTRMEYQNGNTNSLLHSGMCQ